VIKVRRKLSKEEYLDVEIKPYREMFLSGVFGILLRNRGKDDKHVCFEILGEDDGYWFSTNGTASSAWFENLEGVVAEARKWCEENCEPDIHNDIQYGWKFKY